jgi:hypothetical protein
MFVEVGQGAGCCRGGVCVISMCHTRQGKAKPRVHKTRRTEQENTDMKDGSKIQDDGRLRITHFCLLRTRRQHRPIMATHTF